MKLTIDRSKWKRGKENAFMYDSESGEMCPIGFYLDQLGVDRKCFTDIGPVWFMIEQFGNDILPNEAHWLTMKVRYDSYDATRIMTANDKPCGDREAVIAGIFKEHDVEVEFVGG